MNARTRRLSRRAAVTVTGTAMGLTAMSGVGLAYWIATDSTYGAQAVAATLPQGAAPTASVRGATASLTLPPVVTSPQSGRVSLTSYTVHRYAAATGGEPVASFSCVAGSPGSPASCAETSVPEGVWYYADAPTLGNWTGAESVRVAANVDLTAPSVAVSAPAAGTTNPATPTIRGTAGTAATDSSSVIVRIYSGSTATGTPLQTIPATASSGSWSVVPAALPSGSVTVVASQSDAAGNTGTSDPVTFDVDGTSPAVTISTPPTPSTNKTPSFSGRLGTDAGDVAAVSVQLFHQDGSAAGLPMTPTVDAATNTWSLTTPTLSDGIYTAQATQRDAVGNIGTATSGSFAVDTTAPAVTWSFPMAGSVSDTTATFSGSAGTAPGDATQVSVNVYAGSTATGTPVRTLTAPVTNGTWSVADATLGSGQFTATASQTDAVGNTRTTAPTSFFVQVPPKLSIDPIGNGGYTNGATISGAAGTASGDASTVTVILTPLGGKSDPALTANVVNGRWSVTPTLRDGVKYNVFVSQTNTANGVPTTGQATTDFVYDTTAPRLTMDASSNGNSVTLTGTAGASTAGTTSSADDPFVTITIVNDDNGQQVTTGTSRVTGGNFTFSFSGLPTSKAGFSATVTQRDAAGNSGSGKAHW
jgi:hypothetical protein